MKIETWNGQNMRFVEYNGEWWAVGIDVAKALEYANPSKAILDHCKGVSKLGIPSEGGIQETNIIPEIDIYNLVFKAADQSRSKSVKEKAEQFKDWIFIMLKTLRQSTGLEGFQIFRMLDKEHQKETMSKLNNSLKNPARLDFIKANTIANKAVSNAYGYRKMVKKEDMTPDMLVSRQEILESTTELMAINDKLQMNISVSNVIYDSYNKNRILPA